MKMTKKIDLSTITNSKEILQQNRDQLETEIKDIYLGNRTKSYHGDDENGQRKRNKFTTTLQITHFFDYTPLQKGTQPQ